MFSGLISIYRNWAGCPASPIGLNLCRNPLSIFQHAQFAFQARRFIFSDFGMKRLFVCALLLFAGADLFAQQNTPPLQL